jgi:hypothetical protein
MKDLQSKLEKLLIEAEDYDLIGKLATDPLKREMFKRLAGQLRQMAEDIKSVIAAQMHAPRQD